MNRQIGPETWRTASRDDGRPGAWRPAGTIIALVVVAFVVGAVFLLTGRGHPPAMSMMPPPSHVTVATPLVRDIATTRGFLGQFSAIDSVEIRAQVGGELTEIHFKDGQIVRKGDLLFVIDPRPYQIRLDEAVSQLQTALARSTLATAELGRAQQLKQSSFGTAETVDQRLSERNSAEAAIDQAKAEVRDAQLDLDYAHVTAPFTGRISSHRVSVGDLVAGSRAGSSATTLLTTLVSLDPIYLDFDMSESDFLAFQKGRDGRSGPLAEPVAISVGDSNAYTIHGTLDFIDNAVDRSSGTIHARATVPNPNLALVPGQFARLRLTIAPPAPAIMVPDSAVMLDQSQHVVMTVAPNGTVVPKLVQVGGMAGGLRIITAGLAPTDQVIILGLMHAMPGGKVIPDGGTIAFDPAANG